MLYVIGPVTGQEDLNRKAFEDAKEKLERVGYDVTIPHDIIPPNASRESALRLSIQAMLRCGGVAMLNDWEASEGAKLEHDVAIVCGIAVYYVLTWETWTKSAQSLAHGSSNCIEDDNSPVDTENLPPNEVLGALTRRMDEMNVLLRAMFTQLEAVTALSYALTLTTREGRKAMMEKAVLVTEEAAALYESAGKECE